MGRAGVVDAAKCSRAQQAFCRRLGASSVVERPKVVAVDAGSSSPLDELSKVATLSGTESVFGGAAALYEPPRGVEEHRNRLRQLGAEAEKDNNKREQVLAEAIGLLHYEHPLVRLAAVHTVARVAAVGDNHALEAIAGHVTDTDEIVRIGAVRAIGRIAKPGDVNALALLVRLQNNAAADSLRYAARDAEARVRGCFAMSGNAQHPLL